MDGKWIDWVESVTKEVLSRKQIDVMEERNEKDEFE